jgi:site-specific recombinase XerD
MAENDANPVGLQILLGHESLDTTTNIYMLVKNLQKRNC